MYPRLFELGPITVYTYGVLLAAAYLLGLKLVMVRAKSRGLDQTRVLDLAISRFIIENYRDDPRGMVGIFSTSQFISLILAPLSIVMLVYLSRATAPAP